MFIGTLVPTQEIWFQPQEATVKSQHLIATSLAALVIAAASLLTSKSANAGFGRGGISGMSHMGGMSLMPALRQFCLSRQLAGLIDLPAERHL